MIWRVFVCIKNLMFLEKAELGKNNPLGISLKFPFFRAFQVFSLILFVTFAYAGPNDISGRVMKDVEGNSIISDPLDTPLENIHVYLFQDTGNDLANTGDTLVAWTLTDALGTYSFLGLANGTYWVVVESDDINNLGTSVEQTYGGVGALVDPDANESTPATPRTTAGAAFGGRRMVLAWATRIWISVLALCAVWLEGTQNSIFPPKW